MNIYIVDITDRNPVQYNPRLCSSLAKINKGGSVTYMSPKFDWTLDGYNTKKLFNLVPRNMTNTKSIFKRTLRTVETLMNYFYLIIYFSREKEPIIHFQWLPFLEFIGIENAILRVIKIVNPSIRTFLTIHNVYPHDMTSCQREKYKARFIKCSNCFDGFFVHLQSVKEEVEQTYGLDNNKVHVTYHGIFKADGFEISTKKNETSKKTVLMYGYQNYYKGTDILLDAYCSLTAEYKDKINLVIVGKSDDVLLKKYSYLIESKEVEWVNRYVSNNELYAAINEADLLLFPYRKISQSGALLLALSYNKPLLTSNLPSFIETLEGFPIYFFFEKNNPESLKELLVRYLDGDINTQLQIELIERLNKKYSWDETAKNTLSAYSACV